jgi:hypothetical protein
MKTPPRGEKLSAVFSFFVAQTVSLRWPRSGLSRGNLPTETYLGFLCDSLRPLR